MGLQSLALLLLALRGAATDRREPQNTSLALVRSAPSFRQLTGDRRRLSGQYAQIAKLAASDAGVKGGFGYSMAIDGDTIVVGTYRQYVSGAVYVLRTTDGGVTYVEVAKLTADDAAAERDNFGRSVAIDGNIVAISGDNALYIFRTTDGGATYEQVAKLTDYWFGYSVAIDGDTVAINDGSNSIYIFRTTDGGGTWSQVAKLVASDDVSFGVLAFSGDVVVAGASGDDSFAGSAYVFRTNDGGVSYDEVAKLTASDASTWDRFGESAAIVGDTIVIGASGTAATSGKVYVFRTSDGGATYGQVAKLTGGSQFGISVAIDGDTVVVGDYIDGGNGAVYVFRTSDGVTYGQVAKLTASDAALNDNFGRSVAIDGQKVVVGAYQGGNGGPGSAYVFLETLTTPQPS
jgi:hypothetical protein